MLIISPDLEAYQVLTERNPCSKCCSKCSPLIKNKLSIGAYARPMLSLLYTRCYLIQQIADLVSEYKDQQCQQSPCKQHLADAACSQSQ